MGLSRRFESDYFGVCDGCGDEAFCRVRSEDPDAEYGDGLCPECWQSKTGEVFWVDFVGHWIDTGERFPVDDDGDEYPPCGCADRGRK